MKNSWASVAVLIGVLVPAASVFAKDSCVTCHSMLQGKLRAPAKLYEYDIHYQKGLGCADCHGGDPNDYSLYAMSRAKGFRGTPRKAQVPSFCARCHSNIAYMRQFNPKMRADQLSQYMTSVHGKRLMQGDTRVAECVDCHGVHNILAVSDTRAPVYAANVASTCGRCHADPETMKGYGIPTDQVSRYSRSIHAQALAQGDTSAPTCATCHGNHGAAPPGLTSVANVCGTCHVFFAQLFGKSPHRSAFAKMGLPGCVQCHSNHEIVQPSDAFLGVGSDSVCLTCHSPGDPGYAAAQNMAGELARLKTAEARADDVLNAAERSGMEVSSAKLELGNAHEALIKARVNVHTFNAAEVQKSADQGIAIAEKSYEAGVLALRERDVRRKGLGLALIFIVLTVSGLYLKIRQMESSRGL